MWLTREDWIKIITIGGTLLVALAWCLVKAAAQPSMVRFVGLTNDVIQPRLEAFARITPSYEQQWLRSGTNVALFRIRNTDRHPIEVLRTCDLYFKGGPRDGYFLPLLNAPPFSGVYLHPRETAMVAIPLLAHPGRWKTRFSYWNPGPRPLLRPDRGIGAAFVDSAWIEPWQGLSGPGRSRSDVAGSRQAGSGPRQDP